MDDFFSLMCIAQHLLEKKSPKGDAIDSSIYRFFALEVIRWWRQKLENYLHQSSSIVIVLGILKLDIVMALLQVIKGQLHSPETESPGEQLTPEEVIRVAVEQLFCDLHHRVVCLLIIFALDIGFSTTAER